MLTFGSAFAGIGAGDLGLEDAGMKPAWQIEVDPSCRDVLALNFNVPLYDDIRRWKEYVHDLTRVDVVIAGFPCQDLSVAGPRAGIHGAKSGLFFDLADMLGEVRPTWVVLENVPGLLTSGRGRDFLAVLDSLEELGYGVAWRVLDSRHFGVPQRRRRVYIVGHLGSLEYPAKVLFEPESRGRHPAAGKEQGEVIATLQASGAGTARVAGIGSDTDFYVYDKRPQEVARTLTAGGKDSGRHMEDDFNLITDQKLAYSLTASTGGVSGKEQQVTVLVDRVANTLMAKLRINYEDETFVYVDPKDLDGIDIRRLVRRLMPVETERLQGLPDGWTDPTGKTKDITRYRVCGNAMTRNVIGWLGRRIVMVEGSKAWEVEDL